GAAPLAARNSAALAAPRAVVLRVRTPRRAGRLVRTAARGALVPAAALRAALAAAAFVAFALVTVPALVPHRIPSFLAPVSVGTDSASARAHRAIHATADRPLRVARPFPRLPGLRGCRKTLAAPDVRLECDRSTAEVASWRPAAALLTLGNPSGVPAAE